jgi:hypothetical protein
MNAAAGDKFPKKRYASCIFAADPLSLRAV